MNLHDFKIFTRYAILDAKKMINKIKDDQTELGLLSQRKMQEAALGGNDDGIWAMELQKFDLIQNKINNFDINFSTESTHGEKTLVNIKAYSEDVPFYRTSDFIVVGRESDVAMDMISVRRVPNVSKRYSNILSIEDFEIAENLKAELNNEILENVNEIAKELFFERVDNNLNDIFGMMDEEQQKIIRRLTGNDSLWIRGFAGSGKTVVANEILAKFPSEKVRIAFYANSEGLNKSRDFFNSISRSDIKVYTFEIMENIIFDNIAKSAKYVNRSFESYKHLNFVKEHKLDIFGNEIILTLPNMEIFELFKNVPTFDYVGSSRIQIMKYLVKNNEFKEDFYDLKWVEQLISTIRNSFKVVEKFLNKDQFAKNAFELKAEFFKGDDAFEQANVILMDEAPIMLKYPLLSLAIRNKTINETNNVKFIYAFDEFQYSSEDVNQLWKFAHYDKKEHLSIVYRTTKEIFKKAISKIAINKFWSAPVEIKESFSVTIEPKFEKVIKLSKVIEDLSSFIGLEYKELSLDIDVEIEKISSHALYVAMTRAVKSLNVFGKFREQLC